MEPGHSRLGQGATHWPHRRPQRRVQRWRLRRCKASGRAHVAQPPAAAGGAVGRRSYLRVAPPAAAEDVLVAGSPCPGLSFWPPPSLTNRICIARIIIGSGQRARKFDAFCTQTDLPEPERKALAYHQGDRKAYCSQRNKSLRMRLVPSCYWCSHTAGLQSLLERVEALCTSARDT